MRAFSPPFERFVAPARPQAELWRTGAGAALIMAFYAGFGFALFRGLDLAGLPVDLSGRTPASMMLFLATFLGMALAPMLVVRALHRRSISSLFGYAPRALRDFVVAAVLVAAIFAVNVALWSWFFDVVPNLDVGLWLSLLPLIVIGLLVQTGAEELVFRGYLQQQLAARFVSPLAWLILPSLLFAAAHYDPAGFGDNLWPILLAISLFGFVAADLTARTGTIGAAWGFHFTNNMLAISLIAIDGPLTGLALFKTPYLATDPILHWLVLGDIATVLLAWIILRRVLSR